MTVLATASCSAQEPAKVKGDAGQVAFFERPKALAAARTSGVPMPVMVLLEPDPWAMVIGSDSPSFALYADGTLIRRKGDTFEQSKLSEAEMRDLLSSINPDALRPLYGGYQATYSTDQPEANLLVYQDDKPIFISVYGSMKDKEVRAAVPKAIVAAYDKVQSLETKGSRPWVPAKVEVMISPYEYAPEKSIVWHKDWPSIDDPSTVKRGDSYSLFVPSSELEEVQSFLRTRTEKGAVQIDGKKWSASIRYPFPQERLWMAPNLEAKRKAD
jgi:hypothetical protein